MIKGSRQNKSSILILIMSVAIPVLTGKVQAQRAPGNQAHVVPTFGGQNQANQAAHVVQRFLANTIPTNINPLTHVPEKVLEYI
jgi:hypothetical protein